MPKRKREEEIEQGISRIENPATRIKASLLKARFDNGVQQLTAQLKLARGFDRQKMSRRIKQAGSDKAKIERLQAEVQVLKEINEGNIARNYLLKQCVRTKRINEAEAFKALFGDDAASKVKSPASVAESNVLGRLFKSNPVDEVLPGIVKGIREVVGADGPKEAATDVVSAVAAATVNSTYDSRPTLAEDNDDVFEGFSDSITQDAAASDNNSEKDSDDDGEEVMQVEQSLLAASSDDDVKESDMDGQDHDRDKDPMEITTDEEAGYSGRDVQSDEESQSGSDHEELPLRNAAKAAKPPLINDSSFLPSLMHGGYYSGSESEYGDDRYDPDAAYVAAAKPRKNRRGQRERRAIAEKKYGAKAKHLVKAKGAEDVHGDRQKLISGNHGQNAGWDPRRGAVEVSGARPSRSAKKDAKGPIRFERRKGVPTGNGENTVDGSRQSWKNERLHPSWEAAKKRKLQSANVGAQAFSGKKITFD